MDTKEVIDLFEKQIESRDRIINKLLEERKEVLEINKKGLIRRLIKLTKNILKNSKWR